MRAVALRQPLRFLRLLFSRGSARAAPLPTHLLRICAGTLKRRAQCAVSKLESGQSPTSSRQGVLVCGALRLPHDLICLPLLFPQNSLRDFCGNPERQESAFSPFSQKIFCFAKSFWEPKTRGSRLAVRWNIGGKTEGVKYKAPEQLREKRSSAVSTARDGGLSKARRKGYRISTAP